MWFTQSPSDIVLQSALFALFAIGSFAAKPAPISIPVDDSRWVGYDGSWSPVTLRIGTEPQWVYVLPNVLGQEIWVIGPGGCDDTYTCENERGGIFKSSSSTTWSEVGLYELGFDTNLNLSDSANYGYEVVALDQQMIAPSQVVGVINTTEYWTGMLGLGVEQTDFTNSNHLTLLSTLVENNSIVPSHSYGYTAGASYRLKGVPASLTFGGVDANRFIETNTTFSLNSNLEPVVTINQITVSADPASDAASKPNWTEAVTLLSSDEAALFTIDSATPFLWMPEVVCDAFSQNLGLFYNDTLELYTFEGNSTGQATLDEWNLTFTFSIADLPGSSNSINLVLPYDAFDLELSYPFPNLWANYTSPPTKYFPLRKASSSDQYIIGRMFLQETYLTVDYERNNFSLSQARFSLDAATNIDLVEITRPSGSSYIGPTWSRSLTIAAKVGIGIGLAAAVLLIATIILLFVRIRRRKANTDPKKPAFPRRTLFFQKLPSRASVALDQVEKQEPLELLASKYQPTEVPADASVTRFELPASTPIEMEGSSVPSEYYSSQSHRSTEPIELDSQRRFSILNPSISAQDRRLAETDSSNFTAYSPTSKDGQQSDSISPNSPTRLDGQHLIFQPYPAGSFPSAVISPGTRNVSGSNSSSPVSPPTMDAGTHSSARPSLPPWEQTNPSPTSQHLSIPTSDSANLGRSASSRSSRFKEEGVDDEVPVTVQHIGPGTELGSDSGYRVREPNEANITKIRRLTRLMRPRSRAEEAEEHRRRFSWEEE